MNKKKAFGIAAGLFVVIFVVTNPGGAADVTRTLWDGLLDIFSGFGSFLAELVS